MQASFARVPGSAYTGTLYAFTIVGLVPLAALRVVNIAAGILSLIIYSVVTVSLVSIYPVHLIWRDVSNNLPNKSGSSNNVVLTG